MRHAIKAEGLSKRFIKDRGLAETLLHPFRREEVWALSDVTLSVKEGEVFGLLGPNGSGKTTFIKILCNLLTPTGGRAVVRGLDVAEKPGEVKRKVGYVNTEERSFFWRLTGRQNLEFFAALYGVADAGARVGELLELVGLSAKAGDRFDSYSGGMKQRMALARGLLHDPQVLLMDEPTKELDPVVSARVRGLIKDTLVGEQGKTVLLATHDMREAAEVCGRVAFLSNGGVTRVVEEVSPEMDLDGMFREAAL